MENQNLNQENQNQGNQTNNQDLKPKNPKRVAAGKRVLKRDGNGCKHSKFLRSKRKLLWSKKQSQK